MGDTLESLPVVDTSAWAQPAPREPAAPGAVGSSATTRITDARTPAARYARLDLARARLVLAVADAEAVRRDLVALGWDTGLLARAGNDLATVLAGVRRGLGEGE